MLWTCEHCPTSLLRHPDDPTAREWEDAFISEHESLHEKQLDDLGGDVDALKRRLRFPALHAVLYGR